MKDAIFVQNIRYAVVYIILYISYTLINKYVLSVLHFTYPTIFQGWQTLAGALLLLGLHTQGYLQVRKENISKRSVSLWLPSSILYTCSIYSGSVALANLAVPIFISLHNLNLVFSVIIDLSIYQQGIRISRYIAVMFLICSTIMVGWTDPQFNHMGYKWAVIHIATSGAYRFYEDLISEQMEMGNIEKMLSNYSYSVLVLTPASYLFGDALAAMDYPFWDLYRFYVGCLLSGIFGVFLGLSRVRLKERPTVLIHIDLIYAVSKIIVAVLSLLVFDIKLVQDNIFWLFINLTMSVFAVDLQNTKRRRTSSTSAEI